MKRVLIIIAIAALSSCGGSQKADDDGLGQSTNSGGGSSGNPDVDNPNNGNGNGDGDGGGEVGDGNDSQPDPNNIQQPPPGPPFKFVLKNTHTDELAFNMDWGWGANVQLYSGTPPNAKVVLPFATFCTGACGSDDQCPTCKQPEKLGQIKKAQQITTVAPGESIEVEWDGKVHNYQKVKGSCQCFKTADPPPDTYTFRVCGLRLTKSAKKSTRPECSEPTQITIPANGPQVIELEFAGPK